MNEMLPKGWIVATLDDIADWGSGGTPKTTDKKYYNGNIPWLIIADLNNGIVKRSSKLITEIGLHNSSAKWVEIGSVLIAMYGSIGKLGIAGIRCTTNQAIAFTSKIWGGIPNWYLFHYLKYQEPHLLSIGQGGAQKNISQTILKQYLIPLPPFNEQKRIVAKLDQIIPRIDLVKDRLDKIPAIIKQFRRSVLTAAVNGKLTEKWRDVHQDVESAEDLLERIHNEERGTENPDRSFIFSKNEMLLPDSWVQISSEQINDHITKGTTPINNGFVSTGIPYLKVYNIVNNKINFEYKPQFVPNELHNTFLSRSKVFPGDILMNIVGPPLGKIAIVPNTYYEWNINQALAIFRTRKMILNQYLYLVLTEGDSLAKILIETRGVVGQSNLSLEQCRSLLVNLPPLEEQKEIVRQVEKLFTLADKLESHYQNAKAKVDKLSQSILAQAFRGELVITEAELAEKEGRDFESAEKLLDRILEEKAKLVGSKKSPRARKKTKKEN